MLKSIPEVQWKRRCENQRLFCYGMGKFKLERVEGLAGDPVVNRIVKIISGKGMPDILHVNPDLVGTPCFQMKLCQRKLFAQSKPFLVGDCTFSGFKINFPFDGRTFHPGNGSVYGAFCGQDSFYESKIGAPDLPVCHLLGKNGCA